MYSLKRLSTRLLAVSAIILIVSLGMTACVSPGTFSASAAESASQANAEGQLKKLVGAWQIQATAEGQGITFPGLVTFTSDGVVLADEPPSPFETTAHGAWIATGPRTAAFTFLTLVGSQAGPLSLTYKVAGTLEYDAGADTWQGPFTIQIRDDKGNEVAADHGKFSGARIAVERPQ